jgi:hypothetical protein
MDPKNVVDDATTAPVDKEIRNSSPLEIDDVNLSSVVINDGNLSPEDGKEDGNSAPEGEGTLSLEGKDNENSALDNNGVEKEYTIRGEKRFERRVSIVKDRDAPIPERKTQNDRSFFSRLLCGTGGSAPTYDPSERSPDTEFHADCFVQLSKGKTAYRFFEPTSVSDELADEVPVIVCLHGLTNSSYMWGDVADLLADSEQGPQARVLVFDFYGRGRSPWTGVPITLDVLVTQTKELLDCK